MSDDGTAEVPEAQDLDPDSGAAAAVVDEALVSDPDVKGLVDAEPEASDVERDLREAAQRVQADFENYRKRVLREQTAIVERAAEGLVEQLLPVLDSFELALGTLDELEPKVRKGVELVYAELLGVLERAGPGAHRHRRRAVRPERARGGAARGRRR